MEPTETPAAEPPAAPAAPTETPEQRKKRALIGLAAAIVIGAAAFGLARYAQTAGAWVARVDGAPVPAAEYERIVENTRKQYVARYNVDLATPQGQAMEADIKTNVMNQLVERALIREEAARRNVVVTEPEVEAKMAEVAKGFKTPAELDAKLKENGMDRAMFAAQIKDSLIVERVVAAVAAEHPLDEAEVKRYYQDNAQLYVRPDEVHARHILVKDDALAKKVDAMARRPGADFAALAKQYSEDPGSKASGGDLGYFGKGRMVESFEKAAFATAPGKIAPLFKSQFGWHVLKVEDQRSARRLKFEEVQKEIRDNLGSERRRKAFTDWLDARKKAVRIDYKPGFAPRPPAEAEHGHEGHE